MFSKFIWRVGVLRAMLAAVTVLLILAAPFAGGETQLSGWAMMPTLIAPALVPILFFVFPLDMTMSAVYMSGKSAEHKPRYRFIIAMDIVLLLLLILAWLPFFRALLSDT